MHTHLSEAKGIRCQVPVIIRYKLKLIDTKDINKEMEVE